MVEVTQGVQKRWFKYDSLGRLIRVRQPEQEVNTALNLADPFNMSGQWTAGFTYDVLGNVLTATDANGTTITNTYDRAGRVKTRTYSDSTPAVSFYYDGKGLSAPQSPNYAKGKLTKVTSSVSEAQYQLFDNLGRMTQMSQITDGQTYTSKYIYNFSGALVEEEYPSGRKVKNEFESDGDLLKVSSQKNSSSVYTPYASNFSYTASGGISQMKLGNGRWETAKFNQRLQVEELGLGTSATNAGLWKTAYEYGELQTNGTVDTARNTGNIARQTLIVPGTSFTQSYKYDSLYRLTEATEKTGSTQNWTQSWTYDRYGNRVGFAQNIAGFTDSPNPAVDANTNRFSSGQGFTYDLNGNLVVDNDGRQFTFNGDNKQIVVKDAANNVIGQYFFDGEGKRIKKITNSETTVFVYSSGKLVAEYSNQVSQTPTTAYTTTDHLGSPRIITDQYGQVKSRRDFMPFGEDLLEGIGARTQALTYSANTDDIKQKFTGYLKDNETGLDFAEARMYETRFGRFTAVDPLLASGRSAIPQTFNRYVYVGDNPVNVTDPRGLDWYRRQLKDSDQYEYEWFDEDPADGWLSVDFGFFGQYTTFTNACINGTCGGTGYLYRDGGADFGERAARIDGYGIFDALKDTGIGTAQFGYNSLAMAGNASNWTLERASLFSPVQLGRNSYWEPENQVQANANLAWTFLSLYAGGASGGRRPVFSYQFPASSANVTRVVQYEQYALVAARDGMYPVMKRGSKDPVGSIFLKEGDVWKFGQTKNGKSRYSGVFYKNTGAGLKFEAQPATPSFKDVIQMEREQILNYERQFGKLPPGNKIRR